MRESVNVPNTAVSSSDEGGYYTNNTGILQFLYQQMMSPTSAL